MHQSSRWDQTPVLGKFVGKVPSGLVASSCSETWFRSVFEDPRSRRTLGCRSCTDTQR